MRSCFRALIVIMVLFTAVPAQPMFTYVSPNEAQDGYFGKSVSGAGDVNNDGYFDVIIGAPGESPGSSPDGSGRVYVFNGMNADIIFTLYSQNEQLDGGFGRSVSSAGDVNDDGLDDLIVGAPFEGGGTGVTEGGMAYVFDGEDGSIIYELDSPNAENYGHFGWSVSWAGDVNNDGYDDVIVGAYGESPGASPDSAGRAYVFSGETGNIIHTLESPNEEAGGSFGFSVSYAGDLDSDDHDEVIVGAYREDAQEYYVDSGRAYIFNGATGGIYYSLTAPSSEENGWYGYSVSQAGDVNHDNYDDVVVGAPNEELTSHPDGSGRVHIHSGMTSGSIWSLVSPNQQVNGAFGSSVSGGFDANNNGFDDVIIGAPGETGSTRAPGMAYVFSGWGGYALNILEATEDDGNFGFSVSGAGDMNNHLGGEVLVGGYMQDPGGSPDNAGRAYSYLLEPSMDITATLTGGDFDLSWTPCPEAQFYWVYGADNAAFFVPTLWPQFLYRLDTLDSSTTTWSSTNGIGDSDHNWSYVILAVSAFWQEMCRTEVVGEFDFSIEQ